MKKIHLKKIKKIKPLNLIIIIIILIIIGIINIFKYINDKVIPIFMDYAENEARALAKQVISSAVNDEIVDQINMDDLFITSKDNQGNIQSVDFNPIEVNKMLSIITNNVQEYLLKLESGEINNLGIDNYFKNKKAPQDDIIFEIPSGIVLNNVILSNIGPKIPVKLNMIGDISSNINTNVTEYGINNALVQINVNIEVTEQVILPYFSKKVKVDSDIPVAIKIVQGQIPNNYYNGLTSSNLTVPVS